ncbi:MAG: beta-propeller fold lactonase family protein [Burkholderiales bacterium]|nr:beta-propeller fold lactonase family protein [Burkholderiales bacterium]
MTSTVSKRWLRILFVFLQVALLATSVQASEYDEDDDGSGIAGAVYTMSNSASGNAILRFHRAANGTLTAAGSFPTGGVGSGGGLGNQGALILSQNNRWLYAVNAGSNDISVFAVRPKGLVMTDKVSSGGIRPVSLTVDRDLLYVLNAGGNGNISGFTVQRKGRLAPLPGSTRSLSGPNTAPAQIAFNPEGGILVVTEKATNLIDTYEVAEDGLTTGPYLNNSVRATPFGFAFDRRGRLLVSEAVGGAVDAGSVSTYNITENGQLEVISPAVATTETAVCWVVVTKNGRFAYVSNTGSGSLTAYRVARDGSITIRDADGRTGDTGTGSAPLDIAFSDNNRYIYTLNNGTHSLGAFRVQANGGLVALPGANGLPIGANGLAAH